MPSDRTRQALFDIRDNGRLARSFVGELSEDQFEADRRTFYAVTRCLEIVSEACRRLDQTVRDRHPQLPWRAIMRVGNVYRHDYDNVTEAFLWRTVRHHLAPLLVAVDLETSEMDDVP